jgi:hypothetical protein
MTPLLLAQGDLPVTRFAAGEFVAFTADNLGNLYLVTRITS